MPLSFSSPPWTYDSTSPYPPSSPTSSDFEEPTHATTYLRSSIALLPAAKLRGLLLQLSNRDARFQRAIMKELSCMETDASPTTPTTPTLAKQRKWHRKARPNVKNLSISTKSLCALSRLHDDECMYHPGRLEEEVYEFISVLPDETHVVRKVTMWTCCDEDEWSPGCMSAALAFPLQFKHGNGPIELPHADVFPDSDIERR